MILYFVCVIPDKAFLADVRNDIFFDVSLVYFINPFYFCHAPVGPRA